MEVKTGILAGVLAFLGKLWHIIKSASELKVVKKEVLEFYVEGKEALEVTKSGLDELKSFIQPHSDGGKKLTREEVKRSMAIISNIYKELEEAWVEGAEAKEAISNLIKKIKSNG